jgi:hypothetical protein
LGFELVVGVAGLPIFQQSINASKLPKVKTARITVKTNFFQIWSRPIFMIMAIVVGLFGRFVGSFVFVFCFGDH